MLTIISPAKKLNFDIDQNIFKSDELHLHLQNNTTPQFMPMARKLATMMRKKTTSEISNMMSISEELATLTFQRFKQFNKPNNASAPAVMVFNGDTYIGLQARAMTQQDLAFASKHLLILSGLYGLLRPLDIIEAYRLEMGSKIDESYGSSLYQFWGNEIGNAIIKTLEQHTQPVVLNLSSNEYFKVIENTLKQKAQKHHVQIINFKFLINDNDILKPPGFATKKARGQMARFVIQNRIDNPQDCKDFTDDGYQFEPALSQSNVMTFIRKR